MNPYSDRCFHSYVGMTNEDLDEAMRCAQALRNTWRGRGETPTATPIWLSEDDDRSIRWPSYEPPERGKAYRGGIDVEVADACLMAHVPTFEGEFMTETADAICNAGSIILALLGEIERLKAQEAGR